MFQHGTLGGLLDSDDLRSFEVSVIITSRHDVTAQKIRILTHENISICSRTSTGNIFSFDGHVHREVRKLPG
jgi:hypothetical protein